ncbi:MAG: hypothetical protein MRZ34_04810 [Bacillales bacterium]|nr:hypothetical protein [Bacillales bacterium]
MEFLESDKKNLNILIKLFYFCTVLVKVILIISIVTILILICSLPAVKKSITYEDSKLTINDKTYTITTDYSGFNIKRNNNSFYIVFKDADKLLTKDLNTIILYSEINLVSMLALLVLSYMIVFNIGIILSSMKKKIIDENNLSYIKKIATYFLICFSITLLSNITAGIITKVNIELDFKSLFEALITMFIYYIYKYVCTKKDLKD